MKSWLLANLLWVKIGVGILLLGTVYTIYAQHIANVKQAEAAKVLTDNFDALKMQYEQEKIQWETRREELEATLMELSKRKNTVTERIITIEKAKDDERTKVTDLSINDLLNDVIARANRAEQNRNNSRTVTKDR